MNRCATCRHFAPPPGRDDRMFSSVDERVTEALGTCRRIHAEHEVTPKAEAKFADPHFDDLEAFHVELARLAEQEKAVARDASRFCAVVHVHPTFGCVLHEPAVQP